MRYILYTVNMIDADTLNFVLNKALSHKDVKSNTFLKALVCTIAAVIMAITIFLSHAETPQPQASFFPPCCQVKKEEKKEEKKESSAENTFEDFFRPVMTSGNIPVQRQSASPDNEFNEKDMVSSVLNYIMSNVSITRTE